MCMEISDNTMGGNMNERLENARYYIDVAYHDRITLEGLSKIALLNPRYFLKVFKNSYNITPHQYLTKKRLEEAKLLLEKNYKVTEVCKKVGYEDLASFSKLFKKSTGICPRAYSDKYKSYIHINDLV